MNDIDLEKITKIAGQDLVKALYDKCIQDSFDPKEVFLDLWEEPYYFFMEGGSDGTFAHDEFLDTYKPLMPEISKIGYLLAENFDG